MKLEENKKIINLQILGEFNSLMRRIHGANISLEFGDKIINQTFKIVLTNNKFIDDYIINLSEDFYKLLILHFKNHGINIKFNNTRTTFWQY